MPKTSAQTLHNNVPPRKVNPSKRQKMKLKLVALFSVVIMLAAGGLVGYRLLQPSVADVANSSGLRWPSGVHASNELGPNLDFASWRGRAIDVMVAYPAADSWEALTKAEPVIGWHEPFYQNKNHVYVISLPLWPKGQGNVASCASGGYATRWRQFGDTLVNNGINRPSTVVRLGWDFNDGVAYYGPAIAQAGQIKQALTDWKQCWRSVARAIALSAPAVRTDWTLSSTGSGVAYNAYDAYPGDDVVDIIGQDVYDQQLPALTDADFTAKCSRTDGTGLCDVAGFARAHGKKLSVGSWNIEGVCSAAYRRGQGGGDNPLFIQNMARFFTQNRDILAYEAYNDDPSTRGSCSSLYRSNSDGSNNPQSAAEYRQQFGLGSR